MKREFVVTWNDGDVAVIAEESGEDGLYFARSDEDEVLSEDHFKKKYAVRSRVTVSVSPEGVTMMGNTKDSVNRKSEVPMEFVEAMFSVAQLTDAERASDSMLKTVTEQFLAEDVAERATRL